jgi:hypothetical protein
MQNILVDKDGNFKLSMNHFFLFFYFFF